MTANTIWTPEEFEDEMLSIATDLAEDKEPFDTGWERDEPLSAERDEVTQGRWFTVTRSVHKHTFHRISSIDVWTEFVLRHGVPNLKAPEEANDG